MKFAMISYDGPAWGQPAWVLPMLKEGQNHMAAKLQQLIRELGQPIAEQHLREQQERGISDPVSWGRPMLRMTCQCPP